MTTTNSRPISHNSRKVGLARIRNLTESSPLDLDGDLNKNMPNNWYYNQDKEKEFWEELELTNSMPTGVDDDTEEKKAKCFNDLTTSSKRIQGILTRFDDLDQDTLAKLMNIVNTDIDATDVEPNTIIQYAKTSVTVSIGELEALAASQTKLVESVKNWLLNIDKGIDYENSTAEMPDIDDVFEYLDSVLREYTEKTEKVSFLFNDVSDAWSKRVVAIKQALSQKDEEIRKLKYDVEQALAVKHNKKHSRKVDEHMKRLKERDDKIEAQTRTIEKQRKQIEMLRSSLRESEMKCATFDDNNKESKSVHNDTEHVQTSNDTIKYQQIIDELNRKIEDLEKKLKVSQILLKDSASANAELSEQLLRKQEELESLNAEYQNIIQLYEIEIDRNQRLCENKDDDDAEKIDNREDIMKFQLKINELIQQHNQELLDQSKVLHERFESEKNKIVEDFSSGDTTNVIQTLTEDYNKKVEESRLNFENQIDLIKQTWGSKIATLTRQYENRITSLNEQYQEDLNKTNTNTNHELKKLEIELESKFNQKLLDIAGLKQDEINRLRDEISDLKDKLFSSNKRSEHLEAVIIKLDPTNPTLGESNIYNERRSSLSDNFIYDTEPFRLLAQRMQVIENELRDQHKWELELVKRANKRMYSDSLVNTQAEIRKVIVELQEKLENHNDSTHTVHDIVSEAILTFNKITMDSVHELDEVVDLESVQRNEKLTKRVIFLEKEKVELEAKLKDMTKLYERQSKKLSRCMEKVDFLSKFQNSESKDIIMNLEKIQIDYKEQLNSKDKLIQELKNMIYKNTIKTMDTQMIFSIFYKEPSSEYDYYGIDEDGLSHGDGIENSSSQPSTNEEEAPPTNECDNLTIQGVQTEVGLVPSNDYLQRLSDCEDLDDELCVYNSQVYNKSNETINISTANTETKDGVASVEETSKRKKIEVDMSMGRRDFFDNETSLYSDNIDETIQPDKVFHLTKGRRISTRNTFDSTNYDNGPKRGRKQKRSKVYVEAVVQNNIGYFQETENEGNSSIDVPLSLKVVHGDFFSIKGDEVEFNLDFAPFKQNIQGNRGCVGPSVYKSKRRLKISAPLVPVNRSDNFVRGCERHEGYAIQNKLIQTSNSCGYSLTVDVLESIESYKPQIPGPVVIIPDNDTKELLIDLQARLKTLAKFDKIECEHGVKLVAFSRLKSLVLQRKERELRKLYDKVREMENRIKELENKLPRVIYDSSPRFVVPKDFDDETLFSDQSSSTGKHVSSDVKDISGRISVNKLRKLLKVQHSGVVVSVIDCNIEISKDVDDIITAMVSASKKDSSPINPQEEPVVIGFNKREKISYYLPPEEIIQDDQLEDDPFSLTIQSMTSNMRFLRQMKEYQENVSKTLESDYQALETILTATETVNPTFSAFIENVKDIKLNLDNIIDSYIPLSKMQLNLLALIKHSKLKGSILQSQNSELRRELESIKLEKQQKVLESMQYEEHISLSLNIQKVNTAIQTMERMKLSLEANEEFELQGIKQHLDTLMNSSNPDKEDVDRLLVHTHSFISGIVLSPDEDKDIYSTKSISDITRFKKRYTKILAMYNKLRDGYNHKSAKLENIKQQNATLREKLATNGVQADQEVSLYKTQLVNVQEMVTSFKDGASSVDIKSQLINMHHLLETSINETKVSKSHALSLEEELHFRNAEALELEIKIESLHRRIEENEEKMERERQNALFHEADIAKYQKELENHKSTYTQQRNEITKLQHSLNEYAQKNKDLEQKIIKLKKKVRDIRFKNDENEISAFLSELLPKKPKVHIQTQTNDVFETGSIESEEAVLFGRNDDEYSYSEESGSFSSIPKSSYVQAGPSTHPRHNDKRKVELVSIKEVDDDEMHSDDKFYLIMTESTESSIKKSEKEDSFSDTAIENISKLNLNPYGDEASLLHVHAPLQMSKKRVSINVLLKSLELNPKSEKNPRPQGRHSKQKCAQSKIATGLGISDAVVGVRPVSGQNGRRKSNYKNSDEKAVHSISNISILPPLPTLDSQAAVVPELQYENRPKAVNIDRLRAAQSVGSIPTLERPMHDTLVITPVQFEEPTNDKKTQTFVDDKKGTNPVGDNQSAVNTKFIDVEKIAELINKLRQQISSLKEGCEKKDEEICSLKAKNTELSIELQKNNVEIIHHTSYAKRARIRWQDIEKRLQTLFREVSVKEEESGLLRKEVYRLRQITSPIKAQLRRISNAQNQKKILSRQSDAMKKLIEDTKHSLSRAINDSTKNHLEKVLENQRHFEMHLESKRRMWEEIERKQIHIALEALALVNTYPSPVTSQSNSPFLPKMGKRDERYVLHSSTTVNQYEALSDDSAPELCMSPEM